VGRSAEGYRPPSAGPGHAPSGPDEIRSGGPSGISMGLPQAATHQAGSGSGEAENRGPVRTGADRSQVTGLRRPPSDHQRCANKGNRANVGCNPSGATPKPRATDCPSEIFGHYVRWEPPQAGGCPSRPGSVGRPLTKLPRCDRETV